MNYLPAATVHRWLNCQGSAALEELEPAIEPEVPDSAALLKQIEERKTALEAQGAAVEVTRLVPLDIGVITGEAKAVELARAVLIAEWADHSKLEVLGHWQLETTLLTLAGVIKYELLHNFTGTDALYAFGQQVTESGAIALSVRGDVAALSHLKVGGWCVNCRAAYRCPKLKDTVHEEVFGPLQAPDEPVLTPIGLAARLADGETLESVRARLPVIEAWCDAVRGAKRAPPATRIARKPRRKRKRRAAPTPSA